MKSVEILNGLVAVRPPGTWLAGSFIRRICIVLLAVGLTACGDGMEYEENHSPETGGGSQSTSAPESGDNFSSSDSPAEPSEPSAPSEPGVSNANATPTITGNPATEVGTGDYYVFMPMAHDQDGDPLVFWIRNKPAWASFSTETGALHGVPGPDDVGTNHDVIIVVSDGLDKKRLAAFTINVSETPSEFGSVVLSWLPPDQNEDGSALTNLDAYRIYYGTSPNNLDQVVTVNNPGISSFVIEELELVSHYFAASAVNAAGLESEKSNVIEIIPT